MRPGKNRSGGLRFGKAQHGGDVIAAHVFRPAIQHHASALEHHDLISDTFHFIEEVRGKEDGAALIGDHADDGLKNVPAHDRVQSRAGFIEDQQFRTIGQCREQTGLGLLALRLRFYFLGRVQLKLLQQLFRILLVP